MPEADSDSTEPSRREVFTRHSRPCRSVATTSLVGLLIVCLGCSSKLPQVEGTVTLDEEPLAGAFVSFQPVGAGAMATATTDDGGRYSINTGAQGGVAAGAYRVAVTAYHTRASANEQNPPQFSVATPKRYNDPESSGLEAVVEPGKNTFDFALTSE